MRTLSFRRHQQARIKHRRKAYFRVHDCENKRLVGIISETPALCSCYGCGNPRKYGETTIQERSADEAALIDEDCISPE